MARLTIPKKLRHKISYDSQYRCAVCQERGGHIHHIDEDPSNNSEENLILLCNTHHDEAHTHHKLSQNLSQEALRDSKQKWNFEVKENRRLVSTLSGQLSISSNDPLSIGITWGYINHRRVAQLAKQELLSPDQKRFFDYCRSRNIIDDTGILIKPNNVQLSTSYARNSIYDWYEHGDDQRLHRVYTDFVDQISINYEPIHIEGKLTKTQIVELLSPGNFIFLERPFYFKCIEETRENQHRKVHTNFGKIEIVFFVDTVNMFGTTSITVSFWGYKNCSALLQVKSFSTSDGGKLILDCTPIALGVGFKKRSISHNHQIQRTQSAGR